MLRLRPTVISLTMAEVIEFEERRQSAGWAEEENMATGPESTASKQSRRQAVSQRFRVTSNGSILNSSQATEASDVGLGTKTIRDFTDDEAISEDDESSVHQDTSEDEQSGMREAPEQHDIGLHHAAASSRHVDALVAGQPVPAPEPRLLSMTPRRFPRMSSLAPSDVDAVSEAAERHRTVDPDAERFPTLDLGQALPRVGARPDELSSPGYSDHGEGSSRAPATPARQSSLYAQTLVVRTVRPEESGDAIRSVSNTSSGSSVLTEPHIDPRALSPPPVTTPNRGPINIYNDALPADSQPQTPRNLAEARHQSRLEGSYTMPPRPAPRLPVQTPGSARRARWGGRGMRGPSPPGIQSVTPGLRGLYGGRENLYDQELYEEARRDLGPVPSRAERQESSE